LEEASEKFVFVNDCIQIVQRIQYQGNSRGFGDFKRGEQVTLKVKCALYLVLLAKEQTVLQGEIGRLIESAMEGK